MSSIDPDGMCSRESYTPSTIVESQSYFQILRTTVFLDLDFFFVSPSGSKHR